MAGAAATTMHATNSSHGDGGIMWKCLVSMCHLDLTLSVWVPDEKQEATVRHYCKIVCLLCF